MRRLVVLLVLVGFVAVPSPAAAVAADEVLVKKAIADTMTPEQLAAYKVKLAARVKAKRAAQAAAPAPLIPADTCGATTPEVSGLPFGPVADTTVGQTDDYDLPSAVTDPTCTASTTCTGAGPAGSLPRGAIYNGTGVGPDRAYRIETSADCTLTITMDPTGAQDLGLIVYQASCSSLLSDCVCVDDTGTGGVAETVTINAIAGITYYVIVDGYSAGGTPPGPSGPFTLSITGAGCTLTPVELQHVSID